MIGDNFNVPIMYQDLANSTMGPLNMSLGGMRGVGMPIGSSSYLGGVRMQQQPDRDKLEIKHKKENEDKNTFKKAMGVLALAVGIACIPSLRKSIKKAGGISKYLKNKWDGIVDYVNGNNTKVSFWQKIKNKFKKSS